MQITIVKEEYAAEAERLDRLGLPVPEYMVVETVECTASTVQLPSVSMDEIDDLVARFNSR